MRFTSLLRTLMAAATTVLLGLGAQAQNKTNPYTGIAWPSNCNASGTVAYNFLTNLCFNAGSSVAPIVYRGAWNNGTTYALNNAVAYGGNQYISIQNGNLNQNPVTATAYWALLLSSGAVTSIIPGTNTNCTPIAGGKCVGDVTITATGGANPGAPSNSTQVNNGSGGLAGATSEIWDIANNAVVNPFTNYGKNNSSNQVRIARQTLCSSNVQPQYVAVGQFTFCHETLDGWSDAGYYTVGEPTLHLGVHELFNFVGLGITQSHSMDGASTFAHDGDMALNRYGYYPWRGGFIAQSDEAVTETTSQPTEMPAPFGTIGTGGAGATTIFSNFTNNFSSVGVTSYLVSTSEVLSSGNFTGYGSQIDAGVVSFNTTDSHPVSTGYGHLTANCGAPTTNARNHLVSNACTVQISSGGGFGTFATGKVCIGAPNNSPEVVTASAVSGTGPFTITNTAVYAHPSGAPVYQGGMCGGLAAMDNGRVDPTATYTREDNKTSKQFTTYFEIGSQNANNIQYVVVYNGGSTSPAVTGPMGSFATAINTITGDGAGNFKGHFSLAALLTNQGYTLSNFNLYGVLFFQVTGSTGCSITCNGTVTAVSFDTTTDPNDPVINWTQTGNTSTSGMGGSLSLGGTGGYHSYCGAQVAAITPGTATPLVRDPVTGQLSGSPQGDGHLDVTANICNWPAGQTVANPNHYSVNANHEFINNYRETPNFAFSASQFLRYFSGPGWSGATHFNFLTNDTLAMYQGYGGQYVGHTLGTLSEFYLNGYIFKHAPLNGGTLLRIAAYNAGDLYHLHPMLGTPESGGNGNFGVDDINHRFYSSIPIHSDNIIDAQNGYTIAGNNEPNQCLVGNTSGPAVASFNPNCLIGVSLSSNRIPVVNSTSPTLMRNSGITDDATTVAIPVENFVLSGQIAQIAPHPFAFYTSGCSTGNEGFFISVNDSPTNIIGGPLTTGGGSFGVMAFCNGAQYQIFASTGTVGTVSIITGAFTSENFVVPNMSASGHCSLTPTNASAAANLTTTYISGKAVPSITVTHPAIALMTFDVVCANY